MDEGVSLRFRPFGSVGTDEVNDICISLGAETILTGTTGIIEATISMTATERHENGQKSTVIEQYYRTEQVGRYGTGHLFHICER